MGTHYSPPIILDGLVFCVDAGNRKSYPGSGTTWTDLAGTNDGTISGATFSANFGGILNFDGTNDIVTISPSSFTTLNQLSVSIWCRVESSGGGYPCLMSARNASTANDYSTGFNIDLGSASQTSFKFLAVEGAGTSGGSQDKMTDDIAFNNWTHIMVTISTDTITMKINNNAQTDRSRSNSAMGLQYINIGARYYSGTNRGYFDGDIALIHLYNRALTENEQSQIFNAHRRRFGV